MIFYSAANKIVNHKRIIHNNRKELCVVCYVYLAVTTNVLHLSTFFVMYPLTNIYTGLLSNLSLGLSFEKSWKYNIDNNTMYATLICL